MSSQILCASAPAREWETFLSGQTLVSTIQAMLPARISLMYCILYPRWTPIYVGGPGSRTWTSEHPHNDRRSYKALRERDISMPAPCNRNCQAEVSGVLGLLGSKGPPERTSSVRLVRSHSDRVACGRLAINALKHIPTRHQHSQVERHRGRWGSIRARTTARKPPLQLQLSCGDAPYVMT
jgi:hypothetical protein